MCSTKMHINKKAMEYVIVTVWEQSVAMSILHLVIVITVELPALILSTHVAWDVSIQFLQQQQQQQQQ